MSGSAGRAGRMLRRATAVDGHVANLSTAIVTGAARLEGDRARLSALHVVLDTQDSTVLRTRR